MKRLNELTVEQARKRRARAEASRKRMAARGLTPHRHTRDTTAAPGGTPPKGA